MKKIAVFGGTGLVGKQVISTFIQEGFDVVSFQRRKNSSSFGEQQEIVDFDHIKDFKFDGDTVIVCLGTTLNKAGSEEAFVKIDHDLIKDIGVWAKENGVKHFHVISSTGASKKAKGLYLRTKWRMEQSLQNLKFETLCIYRPSLYADINRKPIRLKELISIPVLQLLGAIWGSFINFRPIKTKTLVDKIKANALENLKGLHIFESEDIQSVKPNTFIEYRKKEQYLLLKMALVLVMLWIFFELTDFSSFGLRIFVLTIEASLIFLWVKSIVTVKKGEGTKEKEYEKNHKSFQFMRLVLWIEIIAIVVCLGLQLFPFVISIVAMLILDVRLFYNIKDYLSKLHTKL